MVKDRVSFTCQKNLTDTISSEVGVFYSGFVFRTYCMINFKRTVRKGIHVQINPNFSLFIYFVL